MRNGYILGILAALAALPAAAQTPKLDAKTRDALTAALDDERKAQATYGAILERFGPVRPFVNIVRAEGNHERQLLGLFAAYKIPVPENPYAKKPPAAPATLGDAMRAGVVGEKENIALYDGFLRFVKEPDIRRTFENLRRASLQNHLPAFERGARR